MASKQVISIHGETGHMAVDVKTHGMPFASVEGETEQFREWAWDRTCELFWQSANWAAIQCGFYGASAEGRMNGWAAPEYAHGWPYMNDPQDRRRFLRFERKIQKLMACVPEMFRVELQAYVDHEHEQKTESERIVRQFCEAM